MILLVSATLEQVEVTTLLHCTERQKKCNPQKKHVVATIITYCIDLIGEIVVGQLLERTCWC